MAEWERLGREAGPIRNQRMLDEGTPISLLLFREEKEPLAGICFIAGHLASPVTRAGKHSVELAADQLFNEITRPSTHLGLDRIEPVVEKINRRRSGWL